ncbi:type VI secretion system contractile sheath large subunit [Donghicola sp.]|jgi:type VI secretion system protein ImpD|uniref:type VI secretion system contractile sheath domain-containing protein n=1 Tax=Donghicola sp. TaxID=1929294 RepID=UPI0025EA9345|nr:type VI secretion system contractile sheath large subunit [Donghicola sp.]MCT4577765.1 type VI secretion system contractile sheath large subunit [Donghicola sp.]
MLDLDTHLDPTAAEIVARLLAECRTTADFRARLGRMIVGIDQKMSAQLTEIIDAPPFAALEAGWRGVSSVVHEAAGATDVKIRLFDMSWEELSHDLNSASGDRQTVLYRNVGLKELETAGGHPFGLLLVDHGLSMDIDTEYDEFYTAQLLCALGENCACPILLGVGRDFFGEDDAAWMSDLRRLGSILGSEDYEGWHRLRQTPAARFLGLVWPDVLARGRYNHLDAGFRFNQQPSESDGLWQNGIYTFARTVVAEYRRCAWFGFLKLVGDVVGQGAVLGPDISPVPDATSRPAVGRTRATHGVGRFLSDAGFIPMCESTKSHALYYVGNRSVADTQANPSSEVLTQIQSVLIACRMVHYLKVQIRALIGQIKSASECELVLNNWLQNYCSNLAEAAPEILAKYPLRDARVSVTDVAADQGRFACNILIKPQYQIDHLVSEIQLATELGAPLARAS